MVTPGDNMRALRFREDLWNGMTIEAALRKHNLTLLTAFNILQYDQPYGVKPGNPKPKVKCPERNILERNNGFTLRKSIKGKTKIFGVYDSLEDAVRMREALKEDGWHQRHVDRLCQELGITRRTGHDNCHVRYH